MDAANVTKAGTGEPTVMQQEADTTTIARQGTCMDGKTQIRARIVHVGSEYRRDVTSGTCELCIAEWADTIRDVSFEFMDLDTGTTWEAAIPALHVGTWNGIWEVGVNPFLLSKALRHVTLTVDAARINDAGGRARIALAILEAVEWLDHACEMVERLDDTYIHDDDWDEEGLPWLAWDSGDDSDTRG